MPCRGDIWWAPPTNESSLGNLKPTLLPHCNRSGVPLRQFDHAHAMSCLEEVVRGGANHGSNVSGARLLLLGASNANHVWHAMAADDRPNWPKYANLKSRHPMCLARIPDQRHTFGSHVIDFSPWHIVTRTDVVSKPSMMTSMSSCRRAWTIGAAYPEKSGGMLEWVTHHTQPYDIVAIYVGQWDASFTSRNTTAFEASLERGVAHMLSTWKHTRIILFTCTPCGGSRPGTKTYYVAAVCKWVVVANAAIRRVAAQHVRRVELLDAYQMTISRPDNAVSGYPPGLWEASGGWHFAQVRSPAERKQLSALKPPSAAGEMDRAFANRIFDLACPSLGSGQQGPVGTIGPAASRSASSIASSSPRPLELLLQHAWAWAVSVSGWGRSF